jgi:hypothetical protein
MSTYVRTVITKDLREQIKKALDSVNLEKERLIELKHLTDQWEKVNMERNRLVQEYTAETLNSFNEKSLQKLIAPALEKAMTAQPINAPDPRAKEPKTAQAPQVPKAPPNPQQQLAKAQLLHRILGNFEELEQLNPQTAQDKKPLISGLNQDAPMDQLEIANDAIRGTLGREMVAAANSHIYREELKIFLANSPEIPESLDFITLATELISQKVITNAEMEKARVLFTAAETLALTAKSQEVVMKTAALTQKFLTQQGYTVLDAQGLTAGQPGYFGTANPDYRVQCLIDENGVMSFKHMKVHADKSQALSPVSDYQKALDLDQAESFCRLHTKLLDTLENNGLAVKNNNVLIKPQDGQMPIIIDPKKKSGSQGQTQDREADKPAAQRAKSKMPPNSEQ